MVRALEWKIHSEEAAFSLSSSSGSAAKATLLGSWAETGAWTLSFLRDVAPPREGFRMLGEDIKKMVT